MVKAKNLQDLPVEITHQIFSYLSPASLISARGTCKALSAIATSNSLWQAHCQALWSSKITLQDCRDIPPRLWAFSLVKDGWFRAYAKTKEIAYSPWLKSETEIFDTIWIVYFKSGLVDDNWPHAWHALVECNEDQTVYSIDGLPLNSGRWWVDDIPSFRVIGYPPNIPSRDPSTWCRIMQHISVLMVTEAPEFFNAMIDLDMSIRTEITEPLKKDQSGDVRRGLENLDELEHARDSILKSRKMNEYDRLRNILIARSSNYSIAEPSQRQNKPGCEYYTQF